MYYYFFFEIFYLLNFEFLLEFSRLSGRDNNSETKNLMYADMQTANIMPKICAKIATISTEELKPLGFANTISFMLMAFAKIAILINITKIKM